MQRCECRGRARVIQARTGASRHPPPRPLDSRRCPWKQSQLRQNCYLPPPHVDPGSSSGVSRHRARSTARVASQGTDRRRSFGKFLSGNRPLARWAIRQPWARGARMRSLQDLDAGATRGPLVSSQQRRVDRRGRGSRMALPLDVTGTGSRGCCLLFSELVRAVHYAGIPASPANDSRCRPGPRPRAKRRERPPVLGRTLSPARWRLNQLPRAFCSGVASGFGTPDAFCPTCAKYSALGGLSTLMGV